MIRTQDLKAEMLRKGYTQAKMAKELGITPKTFCLKLKRGVFGSDEIDIMIDKLAINDPMSIFFA